MKFLKEPIFFFFKQNKKQLPQKKKKFPGYQEHFFYIS